MQEKWLVISSYHQTQVEEKEECNIMMVVKLYHSNSASIRPNTVRMGKGSHKEL